MTIEDHIRFARESFEEGTIDDDILINLYSEYSQVEDPVLFVKRAKEGFPEGSCGLASLYLKKILGGGEVVQGIYNEKPHTFLLLDNKVVDITADQYGGPPIYFGPLTEPWTRETSNRLPG